MIDKTKPIMVTGATGFVAGWIVKKLLEQGMTVHAPIRDAGNKAKTKYLDAIAAQTDGKLLYFEADLLKPNSYDKSAEGCEVIIHTASPFSMNVKNVKKQLLEPAVNGTENVLNTANHTTTVKRVVLTSSCAAIFGDNIDLQGYPNQTLTEEQWNTSSSAKRNPYSFSKVLAEKKSWEMNRAQHQWQLVTINPSLVLGPGINPFATSDSYSIVKQLGNGIMKMGVPNFYIGAVDVRDVADAHIAAAFSEEAEGRNIVSAEDISILQLADYLRDNYGKQYPLPKRKLPKWVVWIMAPLSGLKRSFVKNNIGFPFKADNSKSKRSMGIAYIPIKTSINEMFQQLVECKQFEK